jgi:hypothetical protein
MFQDVMGGKREQVTFGFYPSPVLGLSLRDSDVAARDRLPAATGFEPVFAASGSVAVVVANFSDWDSGGPNAEYLVPNWPATPPGTRWREITRDRDIPAEWVGREPLYPWEANVYAFV